MTKASSDLTVHFERIVVQQGYSEKSYDDATVGVDGKLLFVANGKYRLQAKYMTRLEIDEESSSITLEHEKDRPGERRSPQLFCLQGATDRSAYHALCRKLQGWLDKYHPSTATSSNKNPQFTSFLQHSAEKGKMHGRRRDVDKPSDGAFRRKRYATQSIHRKKKKTTSMDAWSQLFPDDEQEDLVPPRVVDTTAVTAETDMDTNEHDEPSFTEADSSRGRRKRLRKLGGPTVLDDDDSTQEEDILLTTPATSTAAVTPGLSTTTQQPQQADAEAQVKGEQQQGGQLTISRFFSNKSTIKTTPALRTPDRPIRSSPALSSDSKARLVRSAARSVRSSGSKQRSQHFLLEPSTIASHHSQSPMKQRQSQLHLDLDYKDAALSPTRKSPFAPSRTPIKEDVMAVLDKQPVVRHRIAAHRSKFLTRPMPQLQLQPKVTLLMNEDEYPWRGLRNLGNTCYLNASVQLLLTTPAMASRLEERGGPLTLSLCQVATQLADHSRPDAVNPSVLKEAMDQKTNKFQGYEQRDAHEFLTDLIDNIHEEIHEEEKEPSKLLPTDDFCFKVQVCLKCNHCGYERSQEETYKQLSINIEKDPSDVEATVQKSLEAFFQQETREVKCEKCADGVDATQQLRILSRPKALLLHLKRFVFEERIKPSSDVENSNENSQPNSGSPISQAPPEIEYVFNKNRDPIDLAPTLSLDRFMVDASADATTATTSTAHDENKSEPHEYSLQALVYHHGRGPSSGHYNANVVRLCPKTPTEDDPHPSGKEPGWLTFDDSNYAKSSLESIRSRENKKRTAYMMLYTLSDK